MQGSAVLYLAAGLGLLHAGARPAGGQRGRWIPRVLLCLGLVAHGVAVAFLHGRHPTPPLGSLPAVASLCAWLGVFFAGCFLRRGRLETLAAVVCTAAAAAVVGASFGAVSDSTAAVAVGSRWSHLHVILASAGVTTLGVASVAGALFLIEDRSLKRRTPTAFLLGYGGRLPSLEALDRVNCVALIVGFPLLTVGAAAGLGWSQVLTGRFGIEGIHGAGAALAWLLYTVLVAGRFGAGWRGRRAAAGAAAGGLLLLLTVMSSGIAR